MHFVDTQVSWRWPEVWLGCRSPCLTAKSHKKGQFCLYFLNFIYTCTHTCVCMCMLRNCLVFALYLWQKHNYFIFFPIRGSLNTGNFFCLFLIVFCMLESWDYKTIVVTVFEVGRTGWGPDWLHQPTPSGLIHKIPCWQPVLSWETAVKNSN